MTTFAYLIEPPFNYRDRDGSVAGCDVELARTVLTMTGHRDIDFVETEFAELLPGLSQGRWQMTTGLFGTEERRKLAAFSRPIWALPDGLLVAKGNPLGLAGYQSVARTANCRLAVIREQIQHQTALGFDVPADRILVLETYNDAARAVLQGRADAYASVARAHSGFLEQVDDLPVEVVTVEAVEKAPATGSFGFNKSDESLLKSIDEALTDFLGSIEHRRMMKRYGFTDAEIDLVDPAAS